MNKAQAKKKYLYYRQKYWMYSSRYNCNKGLIIAYKREIKVLFQQFPKPENQVSIKIHELKNKIQKFKKEMKQYTIKIKKYKPLTKQHKIIFDQIML